MKKILLLSTGGTIASREEGNGLTPEMTGADLAAGLGTLPPEISLECRDILSLDSSNIQPEHWQYIAKCVYDELPNYDGFIITHGTDTMAYTACALSYMLRGLDKPVVITGSQMPMDDPLTDARNNLYTALSAVVKDIKGVTIAFDRKVIRGTRAVKVSTMGFNAFESINRDYVARVFADGLRVTGGDDIGSGAAGGTDNGKATAGGTAGKEAAACTLEDHLCTDVFILKLLPGTDPGVLDVLMDYGYKGIVIEAFGAGGMHYIHNNILDKLTELINRGLAVVVCSQCLYERSDLTLYEVGQRLMECGVISGGDMTTEAASVKLMWALGQTTDLEKIREIFASDYAGEITIGL